MGVADAVAMSTLSKNEAVDLATIMFNTERGPRAARFLSIRDAQRSSDFVDGFTLSRRAELSSEAELDTWHRATLNGTVDDSWDNAERARDGDSHRFRFMIRDGAGQFTRSYDVRGAVSGPIARRRRLLEKSAAGSESQ